MDENGGVVGKGGLVDVGTVLSDVSAIVDEPPLVIDVVDVPEPLPRLFGVFRICFVSCVSRKTSADVEEASVGNGCKNVSYNPPLLMGQRSTHCSCNRIQSW